MTDFLILRKLSWELTQQMLILMAMVLKMEKTDYLKIPMKDLTMTLTELETTKIPMMTTMDYLILRNW